jgi:hypothetical protein
MEKENHCHLTHFCTWYYELGAKVWAQINWERKEMAKEKL